MAANRPSVFNNEFFDAGVPAAGYKLYTYESGTTTPKATYTDQAGTIPNTNPITLDADGMCELWLGSGEYTLALYTGLIGSGGALVKTWDDVGGASTPAEFIAFTERFTSTDDATEAAGLVGYNPQLDYPSKTVGGELASRGLNVHWFMTDSQIADSKAGVLTDCTAAIQSALNYYTQASGGGSVFVPKGLYGVTASLVMDVDGVEFYGAGIGQSIIKRMNSASPGVMNVLQTGFQGRYTWGPSNPTFGIHVHDLELDANKAGNPVGVDDNWDHCFAPLYASRCTIERVLVRNAPRIGIPLSTSADESIIQDCRAYDCDEGGFYAEVSNNVKIVNNHAYNCSAAPFNIGAISFNKVNGGVCSGNTVDGGRDGIYIRNECHDVSVSSNVIRNVTRYGVWLLDETLLATNMPDGISINGNTLRGCGDDSVRVQFSKNITIGDNTVITTASYGINISNTQSVTVYEGNEVTGASVQNINIGAGNTGVLAFGVPGAYTPTVDGATLAGVGTYTVQTGRYSRVGNRVNLSQVITQTAHTGTGQARISLPMACNASDPTALTVTITNTAYVGTAVALVFGGQAYANLFINNGGTLTPFAVPAGAATYYVSGQYEIA